MTMDMERRPLDEVLSCGLQESREAEPNGKYGL